MVKILDVNQSHKTGPFTVTITQIAIADLCSPNVTEFPVKAKDRMTMIRIGMIVENSSPDALSFHPNQGTIVAAHEQQNVSIFFSGEVGGTFAGQEIKEGGVLVFLDTPAEDIVKIQYSVRGPVHAENFIPVGDDLTLEFKCVGS